MNDDIEVRPEEKRLIVMGQDLVVALAQRDAEINWFSVLTGENGWWVEIGLHDDGDIYATAPDHCHEPDNGWGRDALDILVLIEEVSRRPGPPEKCPHEGTEQGFPFLGCCDQRISHWDEPYGGREPGTWDLSDSPPSTPEGRALARSILEGLKKFLEED